MAQSSFQGFLSPRPDKKGGGNNIKSVQTVNTTWDTTTTSLTVNISTVDITKCLVTLSVGMNGNFSCAEASIGITNFTATTVVLGRTTGTALGASTSIVVTVTEYYNVKSRQSGNYTSTLTTEEQITVTSYNTNKSLVYMTSKGVAALSQGYAFIHSVRMVDSTHIGIVSDTSGPPVHYWQLLEFN